MAELEFQQLKHRSSCNGNNSIIIDNTINKNKNKNNNNNNNNNMSIIDS